MRAVGQAALAVAVIGGWLAALLWLSVSVAQITVDRVTSVSCQTGSVAAGEMACHR